MSPEEIVLGELIPIVAIIFSNIAFVVVAVVWWRIKQRRLELQAEVQSKLIDRFGSSAELVEFLKSSTGREFVHGVQKGAAGAAQQKVVAGIRKSIILSFFGKIGGSSIKVNFVVRRSEVPDVVVATGNYVLVSVAHGEFRPIPVPELVRERLTPYVEEA